VKATKPVATEVVAFCFKDANIRRFIMAKRLYVGNLPYQTTDEQLKDVFAQYGEVTSASIIRDKHTGRSKGFGFVEMSSDEAALTAKDKLHGSSMDNRTIVVDEARPMREGEGGGRRY